MLSLVERDRTVLSILTRWTRLLSTEQVAQLVGSAAAARCVLRRLESAGLLERYQVLAKPLAPPICVFRFYPGDPEPNFKAVSLALRTRHRGHARTVPVARVTAKGASLLGATKGARRVRASEATHDLQLAQVALAFFESGEARRWRTEDEIHSEWLGVLPDAEVTLRSGERLVLEGGGAYSESKLAGFHENITPELESRGFTHYAIY